MVPENATMQARKARLSPKTVRSAPEYTFRGSSPSLLAKRKQPVSRPSTNTTCRMAMYAMNSVTTPYCTWVSMRV